MSSGPTLPPPFPSFAAHIQSSPVLYQSSTTTHSGTLIASTLTEGRYMAQPWNREELAWAAGFVDGEGHFTLGLKAGRPTDTRKYCTPSLVVAQCHRQVLEHLQTALSCGAIYGPYFPKNPKANPFYQYRTTTFEQSQAVVAALWPWLGKVKRQQAKKILMAFREFSNRPPIPFGPVPKIPTCHPDRKHRAKGMCAPCYLKFWSANAK